MKKIYSLVLMAAMLLIGTNAKAVDVSDLTGLKSALAAGGEIKLTASINAGSEVLAVAQPVTIDGQSLYYIKGAGASVLNVTAQGKVTIKNVTIYASRAQDNTGGIQLGASGIDLLVENVKINSTCRGIHQTTAGLSDMTVVIKNSTISLIWGGNYDADGTAHVNYDLETKSAYGNYSRGLNIYAKNSTFTIENTTIQGFFYNINVPGQPTDGMVVVASNCIFKGRAAHNVWGTNGHYTYNDCNVTGINNFGGGQEGFACFVFNANGDVCSGNTLIINGGTVVSAVFNETGATNPNANQYFIADRGKNNTITVNNASYSCTKDLGPQKGGVFEKVGAGSTATINGGSYDCPEIIETNQGNGEVVINGGEFDVLVVTSTIYYPEAYESYFDNVANNITINGGTFDIADEDEDLNALSFAANPSSDPVSVVSTPNATYDNQDGSVVVVPKGTEQKTVDPAVKTDLVWGTDVVTDANSNVVLQANQTLTLASGSARAYKLDLAAGAKIVVKSGAKLTLGKGGASFANSGATKPQIIVEQGGTLVVYGQMYNSEKENLLVKASADAYGILIFDPDMNTYGDNHPKGTVEFVTKSFYQDADHYQFERFGIPTYNALESITGSIANTGIYIYENNNWSDLGYLKNDAVFANTARLNKPFVACNLIAYQAAAGATYTFGGALNGNSNAVLNCNLEWNPLANSYTAEVDVEKYLEALASGVNVDHTIYLATPTGLGTYSWDPVDAEWAAGEKLKPMQAFILHNHGTDPEESIINYKNTVWTPAAPAGAPARRSAATEHSAKMRIVVTRGEYTMDNLKMMESATSNHNAVKFMNDDVNIYATSDDKYGIVASEDLNDTYVGFSTVKGGEFTINFTNVDGREFDIIDLENGAHINVMEGSEYTFTTAANYSNDYRFKVVAHHEVPTAIDNVEAAKSIKGIYTITGQYVGETNVWNSLPAGVYVVDGAKRVK